MITVGLLVSGGLGMRVFELLKTNPKVQLLFVLTDRASATIYDDCNALNIPVFKGNPRQGKVTDFLEGVGSPDIILSVNYLFVVEEDILKKARRYAINIHGSLLPKYRGRTPHVWAIINNENQSGLTAHLMDNGCDTGDIIEQVTLPISNEMTGQDLLNEFHRQYPLLVTRLIDHLEAGDLRTVKQDDTKATYFGKRSPEDGLIDWNWQKERIKNWVRAQARPYPGAFTYYQSEMLKIHRIEFSDLGYSYDVANGTILSVEKGSPYIKTPNGVIVLKEFEPHIAFKTGGVLK